MAPSPTTSPLHAGLGSVPRFISALPTLNMAQGGYTVILIPRSENLETKAIRTAYSSTAGTAFVTFDKVRVPVSNTLGKVGKGMQVILSNFNHEVLAQYHSTSASNMAIQRWMIAACALGVQRLVVEECLKYVMKRLILNFSLIPNKVVKSAYRIRKASAFPSRRPGQACRNDFSRRVFPELARVSDLPDE